MIDYEKNFLEARENISEIDKEIAKLFEKRMNASKVIAEYKKVNGIPVEDKERENHLLKNNSENIVDEEIRSYYYDFQKNVMTISKDYQNKLLEK